MLQGVSELPVDSPTTTPLDLSSMQTSAAGSSPASERRLQELQDALSERDQVVQMLTQRLEQAADQLDRWQRSGADRRGPGLNSLPPELIEGQQTLLEQMNRVFGQWEEMQAGQILCRIETQIVELKDLVASGSTFSSPPSSGSSGAARSAAVSSHSSSNASSHEATQVDRSKLADSGWEAIKAAMLAGESGSLPLSPPPASTPTDPSRSLPDPPPFVDVDEASIDDLREAVQSRDEFISLLIRRFVAQDQSTSIPDWEQLNQAPDDLRLELDDLRRQLQ